MKFGIYRKDEERSGNRPGEELWSRDFSFDKREWDSIQEASDEIYEKGKSGVQYSIYPIGPGRGINPVEIKL